MEKQELENKMRDMEHLLNAIKVSIQQGANFLVHRLAPNGPIMREPDLCYIHKPSWGLYAADVDHGIIAKLLDWARKKALQSSGDFFIPGERPEYKDIQRFYRPSIFGRVAVWIGHPLIKEEKVIKRILQYQHKSGGVFNYIGDDPENIEEQPFIGTLETSFFGCLMGELDMKKEALMAGNWLCRFVQLNKENMAERGFMYTNMSLEGDLITNINPGEKINVVVDNKAPKQQFWQVGTVIACLAILYEKALESWGFDHNKANIYLENALALIDFEDTMPLHTYQWPSKCKVGWGAGELLRVLVKYKKGTQEQIEKAYRIAKRVAIYTFLDNQLPNGSWSCYHYPLSELIPEIKFDYKPLKGFVNVPDKRINGSKTIFITSEELMGEFLGEMKSIQKGIEELLAYYRSLMNVAS